MKEIKWVFVFYSLAALVAMAGIGVAVGERSVIGIILTAVVLMVVMGMGFRTKKRMREAGLL
ncbi:YlaF family protein [Indiicoccus explosivorum]|uniref:YlaF family protein n=1 Tax=Indiicoccus explosivorum TaxID=1917864 RepID=UPI000B44601B|nr:YlaF family protein [Indiicoccus explosivorum]